MDERIEQSFFEKIRHDIKVAYFIASIIPLGLLVYLSLKYVLPIVSKGDYSALPLHIGVILLLSVVLSLLGLTLSIRTTNSSISALQGLHNKLNSLIEITKRFRETIHVDILLEDIVKSAINLISVRTGSILLMDDEGNLKYTVVVGENSNLIKDRAIKRGEGFAGMVTTTGQPLLMNDITRQGDHKGLAKTLGINIDSVLCVPLISNNVVIGAIELLNKRDGNFSMDDEQILFSLADQAAISITQSKQFENRHSDLIHITEILMSALDCYSPDKNGHSKNVARYANIIGKRMGLSEAVLKDLYYASIFHDIGFLKIPANERNVKEKMIQHPKLGYDMIKPITLWSNISELILYHHEWYDGSGYPAGIKGNDIPLGSRIISIADALEVLTNKHSYKEITYTPDAAMSEIEAYSGTQFDPQIVKVLRETIKDGDIGWA